MNDQEKILFWDLRNLPRDDWLGKNSGFSLNCHKYNNLTCKLCSFYEGLSAKNLREEICDDIVVPLQEVDKSFSLQVNQLQEMMDVIKINVEISTIRPKISTYRDWLTWHSMLNGTEIWKLHESSKLQGRPLPAMTLHQQGKIHFKNRINQKLKKSEKVPYILILTFYWLRFSYIDQPKVPIEAFNPMNFSKARELIFSSTAFWVSVVSFHVRNIRIFCVSWIVKLFPQTSLLSNRWILFKFDHYKNISSCKLDNPLPQPHPLEICVLIYLRDSPALTNPININDFGLTSLVL